MNISDIKKVLDEGYNNLYFLSNITWKDYRDELLTMEKAHVRQFRNWSLSQERQFLLSVPYEAKFFIIKHVLDALENPSYNIRDLIVVKNSVSLAHSLVANYKAKFKEEFKDFDKETFNTLYVEFEFAK